MTNSALAIKSNGLKVDKAVGSGQGDASADGEGEDEFVFSISKDEYLDLLFEDLELPNLKKKPVG